MKNEDLIDRCIGVSIFLISAYLFTACLADIIIHIAAKT